MKLSKFTMPKIASPQETTVFGLVVFCALILMQGGGVFLDPNNLDSLQTSVAPAALVAVGMMALFITGSFDLSVGAVMGMAGLVSSFVLSTGAPWYIALSAGLAVGLVVGLFNGVLVALVGLNPLIVTLGSMYMTRGLLDLAIGGGRPQSWMYVSGSNVDPRFMEIGSAKIFGVYAILWLALALIIAAELFMRRWPAGRRLFYVGGNDEAARSLGFNVTRLKIACFVFCGVVAALAGVLVTARVGLSSRYVGTGMEMQIIIACLIGGASIAGGRGSVIGAILGVCFMTLVNNGFNLFEIAADWRKVVIGLVLVTVVVTDAWLNLRRQRKQGGF